MSLPRSQSNKLSSAPSLSERETWSEDMVTQQLSAESAVSQLLDTAPLLNASPLLFGNTGSLSTPSAAVTATATTTTGSTANSCTSSATSPAEAKTPLDNEDVAAGGLSNKLFGLEEFLSVEHLQSMGAPANDALFTLPTVTTSTDLTGDDEDNSDTTTTSASPSDTVPRSPPSQQPTPKPIQPAGTVCTSPVPSDVTALPTSDDLPTTSMPQLENVDDVPRKSNGGRKRKAESLEEKEARARERILRNRHAAQMSRDKKRRQLVELETQNAALIEQNALLRDENVQMTKRMKLVEDDNAALSTRLEAISVQLSDIQSTLAVSEMTKILFDGARGSAAARQNEEPLRDVFPAVLPDLESSSTLVDAAVVDLIDSFLDYDWSADLPAVQPEQQEQQQQQQEQQPEGIC